MLALWFDFWDEADWTGGPTPPPVVVTVDNGAGSGGYERAGDDYWEAREAFLKAHVPIEAEAIAAPEAAPLVEEHNKLVEAVRAVPVLPNMHSLDDISLKAIQLALQISQIEAEFEEETLLAFLL